MESLLKEKSIEIDYDPSNNWLIADWKGYQTVDSVKFGCEKMLGFLRDYQVKKIINDNTLLTGIWSAAAEWVAKDWFPRMAENGLKNFAWIYSPSAFSNLSTDETLKQLDYNGLIKTFQNREAAEEWLKSIPD